MFSTFRKIFKDKQAYGSKKKSLAKYFSLANQFIGSISLDLL